jgi:L-serine deaminase
MSYAFSTGRELIALCEKENLTIAEVMIRREAETSEKTRDELVNEMFENQFDSGWRKINRPLRDLRAETPKNSWLMPKKQIWAGTWHKSAPLLLLLLK